MSPEQDSLGAPRDEQRSAEPHTAFVIKDGRSIDYYRNVLLELGPDTFECLVVDDRGSEDTYQALLQEGLPARLLSAAIRERKRYRTIVTTSMTPVAATALPREDRRAVRRDQRSLGRLRWARTILDVLRRVYALTLGMALERSGISALLDRRTGRRWSGTQASWPTRQPPVAAELVLAEIRILFPHGVDLKAKPAPSAPTDTDWSLVLCHGPFDAAYRHARWTTPTWIIGYPRYDHLVDPSPATSSPGRAPLLGEDGRPLQVLWLPTSRGRAHGHQEHPIERWLPILQPLVAFGAITIRPHPKDLAEDPSLAGRLRHQGLRVDEETARDLGASIAKADLVLCDYGGTVFSAVYLDRPVLLLEGAGPNWDNPEVHRLREGLVRISLPEDASSAPSLDEAGAGAEVDLLGLLQDESLWSQQSTVRRRIRAEVFGPQPHGGARRLAVLLGSLAEGEPIHRAIESAASADRQ